MFVDGLMEYSPDLVTEDRMSIDGECAVRGVSVDELLEKTSRTLSGLSRCASLVLSPASNAELQHFEFVPLGENRALAVLVRMDGKVENRSDRPATRRAAISSCTGQQLYECALVGARSDGGHRSDPNRNRGSAR